METHREFEMLVRDYLQRHPGIQHEWHRIDDRSSGGCTKLICVPGSDEEIIVTLRGDAIVIGHKNGRIDFEDPESGLSPLRLATKALAHLIRLLQEQGYASRNET
jgi:hypothetical protein